MTDQHKDDIICNMLAYLDELKEMDDTSERYYFFTEVVGLTDEDIEYYGLEV